MSRPYLTASTDSAALARSLANRAATLGRAASQTAVLHQKDADAPWRQADLVWPIFTKG